MTRISSWALPVESGPLNMTSSVAEVCDDVENRSQITLVKLVSVTVPDPARPLNATKFGVVDDGFPMYTGPPTLNASPVSSNVNDDVLLSAVPVTPFPYKICPTVTCVNPVPPYATFTGEDCHSPTSIAPTLVTCD